MFFGPSAGAGATASAVSSDILNLVSQLISLPESSSKDSQYKISNLDPLLASFHQKNCKLAPSKELVTRFYARFLTKDQPGVIGKLGTCFGKCGVSLESIVQTGFQDKLAEIVVVTHDVTEGSFQKALDEIRNLEAIDSIPSLLRVL